MKRLLILPIILLAMTASLFAQTENHKGLASVFMLELENPESISVDFQSDASLDYIFIQHRDISLTYVETVTSIIAREFSDVTIVVPWGIYTDGNFKYGAMINFDGENYTLGYSITKRMLVIMRDRPSYI